ncbi:MAG: helix-turn-helix transcriptional regulator [Opitutaceae bacterium]|jgi:transcriptional regulator with XRE-family HTH domain|nr:helix-turn-helix transcriptional regulator [Opitutaceae bacterium]
MDKDFKSKKLTLSFKLRELRHINELTQQKVSEYLGIKQGTYTKYETGLVIPPPEKLLKLSELFRVTVDYLLGVEGKDIPPFVRDIARDRFQRALANLPPGAEDITDVALELPQTLIKSCRADLEVLLATADNDIDKLTKLRRHLKEAEWTLFGAAR